MAFEAVAQSPTVPASNIQFTFVGCNEFTATWTNGNGAYRVVFVKQGSSMSNVPVQSEFYTDNSVFGKGETIKNDSLHYCVYRGTGNTIRVTGLKNLTKYYLAVFEYNGGGSGVYNYLTSTYPLKDTTTKNIVANFNLIPNSHCLNGNTTTFNNTSYCDLSPLSFTWNFGDCDTSLVKNPKHVYKTPGEKRVNLIATASGCYTSKIKSDTIYPHPVANFGLDPLIFSNDSIQCWYGNRFTFKNHTTLLDIGSGPSSIRYEWYDNMVYLGNGYKADIHFTTPGIKKVKLVAITSEGCRDSTYNTYKVLPRYIDPSKVIVSPKSMKLLNNLFTFTNNSAASVTHKWLLTKKNNKTFHDSVFGSPVNYSFASAGWYYVVLETKDTLQCIDKLKDSVEVISSSSISLKNAQTISIYPNPSKSGIFNIGNLPIDALLKVYTIIGEELLNISPNQSNHEINLSRFGQGTFILSLWREGRRYEYRLVVI